jgi:molecular chaperone DnaJ
VLTDYYQTLGVGPSASKIEIRHAFLKLARSLHPDMNPDPAAAERFKQITAAYDAIIGGAAEVRANASAPFAEHETRRRRQQSPLPERRPGEDIEVTLSLTLKDTFSSATREVRVATTEVCDDCAGLGFLSDRPGASVCELCMGTGVVFHGAPCPMCNGAGRFDLTPCRHCRGEGRVEARRVVRVEIPTGAAAEEVLRFPGKGNAGVRGGDAGDLDVKISVKPDPFFARTGDDLTCTLSVPMTDAVLGGAVSFVSWDGPVDVVVEAGMQSGEVLSFPERGFPRAAGPGRGDLRVTVSVEIPQDLSPRERQMIEWFRDIRADDSSGVIAIHPGD